MVVLAKELKLDVIAEGIEDEHQARGLLALGVATGQGYLLGRPSPAPVRTPLTPAASAGVTPPAERC
jgi:diguanylate cyclase